MSSQRTIIGYTAELERQAWDDEGREKDRQKALSGASEGDGLALGGLEGPSSAGVSATADLQGMTSRFDWYLDRVVHLHRSGTLTVNHDVVRATSDLGSDCLMRHLQGCCHLRSPLSVAVPRHHRPRLRRCPHLGRSGKQARVPRPPRGGVTRRRQQLASAQIADQVNAPGSWCPWVTPCVCPHCLPPHHSTGMGPGTV